MKKFLKKFAVVALLFTWVFSGYPGNSFNKIQTVYALLNDATVEVLGGGGGGGVIAGSGGGGGGGGEYRRCTETLSVQSYTVTVGVGGTADNTGETDSTFSGTGITLTADGGNGSATAAAGTAGTGGVSTDCDTAVANFNGGTPGAGNAADRGGGAGGGAGYGGVGGNGATATTLVGGGGGGGGGESGAGGNASGVTAGTAGSGGGGAGGNGNAGDANGSPGTGGTPATYHIVGGGGGGGSGGATSRAGGACGAPGAGSGGGEVTGAGNGCRGEVRIIYVDSEVDATGGTETTSGSFRIHTFTSSGTFTVNSISADVFTVTTNTETNVTTGSATINGEIAATGGSNATVRGFAWGTDSSLAIVFATTTESGDFGTGTFSQNLSGLISGVTYYFRAYATNPSGTAFGNIDNLVTGTNTTPNRRVRLFEGFRIIILEGGRLKVY